MEIIDKRMTYLFFDGLCLVLACIWEQVVLEQILQFLGKGIQLLAIGMSDHGGTHNCLEELSLEHNFHAIMDIIRFDSELLVKLLLILLF